MIFKSLLLFSLIWTNLKIHATGQTNREHQVKAEDGKQEECPTLEGDMDALTQEEFLNRLTHVCRYDKLIKPETEGPLQIFIQLDLRHIEAIEQLQFRTHMLAHYRYQDNRLAFANVSPSRINIQGEERLRDRIWVPHLVLRNERRTQIMGLESKDTFVSINPKGEVIFSYRMSATIYCWMDLKKFPFDMQTCNINMVSWAYNASNIILQWEEGLPVKVAEQLHLTEFKLSSYYPLETQVSTSLTHSAFVGNYSAVVFSFNLQREIGFYLLTYYIPSIMLVCTSWVTFYLQADASAPRAILGTSTMLTFITLSAGQTRNLPKVSYIKFSEIWFLGIAVFIFASMAEFALVNMVWRRSKNIELKKKSSKYILKSSITPKTSRRQFERSLSSLNLPHVQSADSEAETQRYRNYLTIHGFPGAASMPEIKNDDDYQPRRRIAAREDPQPSRLEGSRFRMTRVQEPQEYHARRALSIAGWTTMTPHEISNWIDKRSRIVFPIAFIIFNVLYWSFVYIF